MNPFHKLNLKYGTYEVINARKAAVQVLSGDRDIEQAAGWFGCDAQEILDCMAVYQSDDWADYETSTWD